MYMHMYVCTCKNHWHRLKKLCRLLFVLQNMRHPIKAIVMNCQMRNTPITSYAIVGVHNLVVWRS